MAIKTPIEEKKRQQKLLIVLAAVILAILIILYFGVWSKKNNSVVIDIDNISGDVTNVNADTNAQIDKKQLSSIVLEEKIKKARLNIDVLNKTIFPFLKLYGDLPVKKGTTGRLNPFAPQ
jgi:hypothetical protein